MANFTALKTAINNAIKTNGNEEITGAILQAILDAMVETLGDSAINDLENALAAEVTNRENAVGSVASDLTAEAEARAALDYQVNNRINQEEYNRQNADAALSQTMSQGFQTLGSQMTALNAAISALNAAYQNGYLYGGIATPSSSPSNNKCFYIALQGGTYTNFGGVGVVQGINILKNDNGWKVEHIYDQTTLLNEFYLLRQQVIQAITSFAPIVIEGDVTNAPDEEDLTSNANHLLQFKNNAYSPLEFSGLGRKYLRKNIAPLSESAAFNGFVEGVTAEETLSGTPEYIFWDRMNTRFVGIKDGVYYADWSNSDNYIPASTSLVYMYQGTPYRWDGSDFSVDETEVPNLVNCLTQDMINEANTIYIIRYDYTLKEDITIPANCVLQFDGGSFNGVKTLTLSANNTIKNGVFTFDDEGYIIANDNTSILDCVFNYTTYCKLGLGTIYAKNKNKIVVVNCTFNEQQTSGGSKCSSVHLDNCTDFLISNNISRYSEGENIIVYGGTGIISNNIIYQGWSCVGTSISSEDNPATPSILIIGNYCHNAIAAGITINCDNVTCSENNIEFVNMTNAMYGPGIRFGHPNVVAKNCVVRGNTIRCINSSPHPNADPSAERGISFDYGDNNVAEGNYIDGFINGIVSSNSAKYLRIIGNILENIQDTNINVYHILDTEKVYTYEVSGNSIKSGRIGIEVTGSKGNIIGNTILLKGVIVESETKGYAFKLADTDVVIKGNKIESVNFALTFSGANVTIESNDIKIIEREQKTLSVTNVINILNNTINNLAFRISTPTINIISNFINQRDELYIAGGIKINISKNIFEGYGIWFNNSRNDKESVAILDNISIGTHIINHDTFISQCTGKIVSGRLGRLATSSILIYDIDTYGNLYPVDRFKATDLSDVDTRSIAKGFVLFNTDKNKPYFRGDGIFLDGIGNSAKASRKGGTSSRPLGTGASSDRATLDSTLDVGFAYFDTDLGYPIYAKAIANDGTVTWVDATGTEV